MPADTDLTERIRRIEGQAATPKPRSPTATRSKKYAFAQLDELRAEALAGASNEALARAAGVPATMVQEWRRARGIRRNTRKDRVLADAALALDPTGTNSDTPLHDVDENSLPGGAWEVPQFLLREMINYTGLARLVYELRSSGETIESVASAFGFRTRDVILADDVWRRHLRRNGVVCSKCSRVFDPRYGKDRGQCRRC